MHQVLWHSTQLSEFTKEINVYIKFYAFNKNSKRWAHTFKTEACDMMFSNSPVTYKSQTGASLGGKKT